MYDNQLGAEKKQQDAAARASAAADLRARQQNAQTEAWSLAGKSFKYAQDKDAAEHRLIELEEQGLISAETRDQTIKTLIVKPPAPTHAEQRKTIEAQIAGDPLDAKNMSQAVFNAMWAAAGKSK